MFIQSTVHFDLHTATETMHLILYTLTSHILFISAVTPDSKHFQLHLQATARKTVRSVLDEFSFILLENTLCTGMQLYYGHTSKKKTGMKSAQASFKIIHRI